MSAILLIEDSDDMRFLLEEVLSDVGHRVCSAQDGRIGLETVKTFHPDLVVLDLMMPGIPGDEVLRQLKAEYPEMPVVIYTASPDCCQEMLALGADSYLVKSAEFVELTDEVARLLAS